MLWLGWYVLAGLIYDVNLGGLEEVRDTIYRIIHYFIRKAFRHNL